jgi:RepB DNA-primase from phage plasmid
MTTPQPNLDQTRQFLELLDPDTEAFTFQTFDDSPAKSKALAKIYHGTIDHLSAPLARLQAAGAGVFVTVNVTDLQGRKRANVVRVRAAFGDLDGAPLQPVLACMLEPHVIVESSPGRWHCYWICDGLALDQFGPVQKAIIARFSGDPSVHDLPRVMRLPGFYHLKAEHPFMTRIHGISDRLPYTAEQILAEFPPVKPSQNANGASDHHGAAAASSRFAAITTAALADLDAWVPALFPTARAANGGYRISSGDLSRDLEEDLSITAQGIKDFGIHDLGDPRQGKRTPIDLVIEHRGEPDALAAARWLALQLGVDFESADALHVLSHDRMALDMARLWYGDGQHAAAWGRWLFWAPPKWHPDETLTAMTKCREYLRASADALVKSAERGEGGHDHDDRRAGQEDREMDAVSPNGGGRAEPGA